ncbi:CSEP0381 putative effector protein [Blumeria hordei DH14]|uniref:CSEP0381 putative effector protein n=1 Tax=Blumeria graminis f. sp. hordei (strain DH14) TaxID=546991 RepID=N1JC41_BLUG1|nr:CSEP0381 putative effector protein [Blumeria hordei DH14]
MKFLFSTLTGVIVGLLGSLHVQAATFECPFGRYFTSDDILAASSSRSAPDKVTYQNGHTINWYFLNRYTHNDELLKCMG